jgi:RNA polymerase sigma-70 factor (ECF subfamily)
MDWEERDLVARAQARDTQAFEVLIRACQPGLARFCQQEFGLSVEDVQDVLQETCLRAWRHIDRFRGEARFGTWLQAIATNVGLELVRRNGRILIVEPEEMEALSAPHSFRTEAAAEVQVIAGHSSDALLALVQEVAEGLREPDATICQLRFVAGLTSAEIGPLVGLTAVNVRTRLCRHIRPRLQAALRREQCETDGPCRSS